MYALHDTFPMWTHSFAHFVVYSSLCFNCYLKCELLPDVLSVNYSRLNLIPYLTTWDLKANLKHSLRFYKLHCSISTLLVLWYKSKFLPHNRTDMGNYTNVSFVILTPYSFLPVYITTVIFQVIGLVFNAVFIHISYKGSDKHSDVTLLLASSTQLGQALVSLVKYIYVLVCRDDNTSLQWYFIFGK